MQCKQYLFGQKTQIELMDLRSNLGSLIETIVPSELPLATVKSLENDLVSLIESPAASTDQLPKLMQYYKSKTSYSPSNVLKWQKLEAMAQFLTTSRSREDISRYLAFMKTMIDDSSQPENARQLESYLDTHILENHNSILSPSKAQSTYAESFENIDRFSDRRSIVSSAQGRNYQGVNSEITLSSLSDPYYSNMVNESEIMKFVPFTLLATTSSLFTLDKQKIEIPNNIPNGESGVLHLLFEAGLLYQYLQTAVDEHKRSNTVSPLKMSFLTFISEKLSKYVAFVNHVSNNALKSSLKSLYLSVYNQILEFRVYYQLIKKFEITRGDEYLSEFDSLRHHGDPLISNVGDELFKALISLYHEYMVNWLVKGQLGDTHSEFFIERLGESHENDMQVEILFEKIPVFIPQSTAEAIYVIGKTYLFLEIYCNEIQWADDFCNKYSRKYEMIPTNQISDFFPIVYSQYSEVNYHCNVILKNKFYYYSILKSLKDLLLMGRSDFIEIMIKNSSSLLQQPSNSLPSYRLTRCLHDSVQQSSLRTMINKIDNNFVINGLDARVLELGHGSIGWDVFTLDYVLEPPLSIVLNVNSEGSKKEYLRIFNFLWRIKKNNYFYQKEWLRQNSLTRDFRKVRRNRPLVTDILNKVSKVNALRNRLQHFNKKVEAFCFHSIIESNYEDFQQKLMIKNNSEKTLNIVTIKSGLNVIDGILKPKSRLLGNFKGSVATGSLPTNYTMDELKSLHDEFLKRIVHHKLLDSITVDRKVGAFTNQYYPTTLIILLGEIFEFIMRYSKLINKVHEILIQLSLQGGGEINNLLSEFNMLLKKVVTQYKIFQTQSYLFMKDLKADGDDELDILGRIFR